MNNDDLIMELTQEQGPGRETQVQPPKGAWTAFFQCDIDNEENLPTLVLNSRTTTATGPTNRPAVSHDHNWTIEIPEAEPPRPAIIRIHRVGINEYDYWVHRPPQPEFDHCSWLLDNFPNPLWSRGRRWLVI